MDIARNLVFYLCSFHSFGELSYNTMLVRVWQTGSSIVALPHWYHHMYIKPLLLFPSWFFYDP